MGMCKLINPLSHRARCLEIRDRDWPQIKSEPSARSNRGATGAEKCARKNVGVEKRVALIHF